MNMPCEKMGSLLLQMNMIVSDYVTLVTRSLYNYRIEISSDSCLDLSLYTSVFIMKIKL